MFETVLPETVFGPSPMNGRNLSGLKNANAKRRVF